MAGAGNGPRNELGRDFLAQCLIQHEYDAFHTLAVEHISACQQVYRIGGSARPRDFTNHVHGHVIEILIICPSSAKICMIPSTRAPERHLNLCELLASRCRKGKAAGFVRVEGDATIISGTRPEDIIHVGISTQRDALLRIGSRSAIDIKVTAVTAIPDDRTFRIDLHRAGGRCAAAIVGGSGDGGCAFSNCGDYARGIDRGDG